MNWYLEVFGYIGTALVLLSMMMTSVVKLRIYNILGSFISMTYAFLCNTWPVVLLNLGLIIINIWQLLRLNKHKVVFAYLTADASDKSLKYFLDYYKDDIRKFFPEYEGVNPKNAEVHMVYAEGEPAGIMIGTREKDELTVQLDYSTPKYRDCSVARFLFPELSKSGISRLVTAEGVPGHNQYLTKMGFEKQDGKMCKQI